MKNACMKYELTNSLYVIHVVALIGHFILRHVEPSAHTVLPLE